MQFQALLVPPAPSSTRLLYGSCREQGCIPFNPDSASPFTPQRLMKCSLCATLSWALSLDPKADNQGSCSQAAYFL